MSTTHTGTPVRRPSPYNLKALLRDYGFVMPGFFLSLASFIVLVTMFSVSVPLIVVWVGVVLLPITLWLAGAFADLDRARLRWWGHPVTRTGLAPKRPGVRGFITAVSEPRRWLDLVYKTVIAFPLHTFTFVVAVSWTAGALGGITELFWGRFIPEGDSDVYVSGVIVDFFSLGQAPHSLTHSIWLEHAFNFVGGVILLVTLPLIMRALALLDATVMGAALGGANPSSSTGEERARRTDAAPAQGTTGGERTTAAGGFVSPEISATGWAWIAASTAAVVMLSVSWPLYAVIYGVHPAIAMVFAVAQSATLLLAVKLPGTAIALQSLTVPMLMLCTAQADGAPWPWPVPALLVQCLLVLLTALLRNWKWAAAAWAFPQLVIGIVGLLWGMIGMAPFVVRFDDGMLASLIVAASVSLAVGLLGVGTRALAVSRTALNRERRTSAELSAQQQEMDERTRIARELHDVVAHSMSVISVQATTAPYRLPGMDEPTQAEFGSIADSSRQALAEMRSLLTLLRTPTDAPQPELAPQATLGQIPDLIESTRATGTTITTHLDPLQDDDATPATGLAAYRILQEGLSNAVRHSPGATIEVTVLVTEAAVEITVENGPATTAGSPKAPEAGLGLAGVRERAQAVGGQSEANATDGGGFRLSATLPR